MLLFFTWYLFGEFLLHFFDEIRLLVSLPRQVAIPEAEVLGQTAKDFGGERIGIGGNAGTTHEHF